DADLFCLRDEIAGRNAAAEACRGTSPMTLPRADDEELVSGAPQMGRDSERVVLEHTEARDDRRSGNGATSGRLVVERDVARHDRQRFLRLVRRADGLARIAHPLQRRLEVAQADGIFRVAEVQAIRERERLGAYGGDISG